MDPVTLGLLNVALALLSVVSEAERGRTTEPRRNRVLDLFLEVKRRGGLLTHWERNALEHMLDTEPQVDIVGAVLVLNEFRTPDVQPLLSELVREPALVSKIRRASTPGVRERAKAELETRYAELLWPAVPLEAIPAVSVPKLSANIPPHILNSISGISARFSVKMTTPGWLVSMHEPLPENWIDVLNEVASRLRGAGVPEIDLEQRTVLLPVRAAQAPYGRVVDVDDTYTW